VTALAPSNRCPCKLGFPVTCSARTGVRLDPQLVIDGLDDSLPGSKILFRSLYGTMPEQELNLLKLSTG
jgi:hypothetical protein